MTVLGIIPARGGSKGIPNKNLAAVAGRSLLAYTCEAALASRALTRVVLSTDDPQIADAGRRFGIEVPFPRSPDLAQDDTPMLKVLQDTLVGLLRIDGYRPDAVVLLQPTSPLRRAGHIDAAVRLLEQSGAESVVSVVPVPHRFSPMSVLRLDQGRLTPFSSGPSVTRRQDKPVLYARNGPAVLAVRRDVLVEHDSLYGVDCRALVMSPEDSVDVDTPFDLDLVEFLLARRKVARGAVASNRQ